MKKDSVKKYLIDLSEQHSNSTHFRFGSIVMINSLVDKEEFFNDLKKRSILVFRQTENDMISISNAKFINKDNLFEVKSKIANYSTLKEILPDKIIKHTYLKEYKDKRKIEAVEYYIYFGKDKSTFLRISY